MEEIDRLEQSYRETGNPCFCVRAFLQTEEGIPLPEWVITWLRPGMKTYAESKGNKSLDILLGFRRKGRGRRGAFRDFELMERNRKLTQEVIRLTVELGKQKKAAYYEASKGEKITPRTIARLCIGKETSKKSLRVS